LNFFGLPKKFNITDDRYTRVIFPENLILEENGSLKVDDEGQLLAYGSGKTLTFDE